MIGELMFAPAVNGQIGKTIRVKSAFFSEAYKIKSNKECLKEDYAILELEETLVDRHGYLGMDTRPQNIDGNEEL